MFRKTCTFLNGTIPIRYANLLYDEAIRMLREQQSHADLKFTGAEGCLVTSFSTKTLVNFSGVFFIGTLEFDACTRRFEFLIDPRYIEDEAIRLWVIRRTSDPSSVPMSTGTPRPSTSVRDYGTN